MIEKEPNLLSRLDQGKLELMSQIFKPNHSPNSVCLFDRPTPLDLLIGDHVQIPGGLLVKRDDLASPIVGGSKQRALELILAEALNAGIDTVVGSGFAGSTSLTVLAVACARLSLRCIAVTSPVRQTPTVVSNLAIAVAHGCQFKVVPNGTPLRSTGSAVQSVVKEQVGQGRRVFVVPFGATHPRGIEGYAQAIDELAGQLKSRRLLVPTRIYVACATGRLALGLAIGVVARQLPTKIVAVRVAPLAPGFEDFTEILEESSTVEALLINQDEILSRVRLVDGTGGQPYGAILPTGQRAAKVCQQMGGPSLDQTYTAKAFAIMLAELEATPNAHGPWLFWHSANGRHLSPLRRDEALKQVPGSLFCGVQ
ncbi:MAG: pyridoxal-phosphate dependent enzyme [Fischerella sp. CENA71]|nr:pyridoxal-phosphate dependent enzyme [Fischerella sp. CENA71]